MSSAAGSAIVPWSAPGQQPNEPLVGSIDGGFVMLITLERGGGIAGGRNHQRLGPIDTDEIDTGDRGLLVGQIEQLNFFDMQTDWPDSRRITDAMWHTMEVRDGGRQRVVKWTDRSEVPALLTEATRLASQMGEWKYV